MCKIAIFSIRIHELWTRKRECYPLLHSASCRCAPAVINRKVSNALGDRCLYELIISFINWPARQWPAVQLLSAGYRRQTGCGRGLPEASHTVWFRWTAWTRDRSRRDCCSQLREIRTISMVSRRLKPSISCSHYLNGAKPGSEHRFRNQAYCSEKTHLTTQLAIPHGSKRYTRLQRHCSPHREPTIQSKTTSNTWLWRHGAHPGDLRQLNHYYEIENYRKSAIFEFRCWNTRET